MEKIIFEKPLTDYERLIWKKLAFYVNGFNVTPDSLQKEIANFNLTMPSKLKESDILTIFQKNSKICFKDDIEDVLELYSIDKGTYERNHNTHDKEDFVPCIKNAYKLQSLMINKWNKSLNESYKELSQELSKEDSSDKIATLSKNLFDYLAVHVNQVSQYFLDYRHAENIEMSIDEFCKIKPIRHQFEYRSLPNMINTICSIDKFEKYKNSIKYFTLLYPTLIFLRGYCAFSTLIALFLDAKTLDIFPSGFSKLIDFMLSNFQNSSIYRIERPTSPPINSDSVSTRGAESFTTRLKIYLYDKDMNPVLLRLDLPHKGEEFLHINIHNLTNHSCLNHFKLEANLANIDAFFDSIHEQIALETPDLFIYKNSSKEDDKIILQNMQDLIYYDELCLLYLYNRLKQDNVEITDEINSVVTKLSFKPDTSSYADLLIDAYSFCKNTH